MDRVQRFFNEWYWPKAKMSRDDWIFVGIMIAGAPIAFGMGLVIGFIITR
jgi:hypothetical protein